MTENTGPGEAA